MTPKTQLSLSRSPKAHVAHLVSDLEAVLRELRAGIPREWFTAELTMPQFRAVLVLLHDGPLRMGAMAERLGVSCSNATGVVDRLVEKGLVERRGGLEDRRSVVCGLSGAGRNLAERLLQWRRSHWEKRLAGLTDEQTLCALEGLRALREGLACGSLLEGAGAGAPGALGRGR